MTTTAEDVWQLLAESDKQISRFGAKFGDFTEALLLQAALENNMLFYF